MVVHLIMNHQCMVMNHLKYKSVFKALIWILSSEEGGKEFRSDILHAEITNVEFQLNVPSVSIIRNISQCKSQSSDSEVTQDSSYMESCTMSIWSHLPAN